MRGLMHGCAAAVLLLAIAACGRSEGGPLQRIGDVHHGRKLVAREGCGTCHDIPGVAGAEGRVGPPLGTIGVRTMIAGMLPNTPPNLVHWIRAPQSVVPGNAMPDMEISEHDARDIAAFLYTLR